MRKISKKAILLLAIFALSLLPTVQVFAVSIDSVTPGTGDKGDEIKVYGSGVTAGMDVNLYWDAVSAWADGKGLLNSTEAEANGDFEVWFDVPAAVNGDHYLWVKDTDTGDTYMFPTAFDVFAKLSFSPSSGLEGDTKIKISGYGFSEEEDIIDITFDGVDLTTSPSTPETDEWGSWSATFTVPDVVGYGDYPIYAVDNETVSVTKDFTVGAAIEIDVDEGPVGTVVKVIGRGFTGDEVATVTLDGVDCGITDDDDKDIDGDGDFKLWIVIPSVANEDEYDINVTDNDGTHGDEEFEVLGLAEIELTPSYGVQGTAIEIHGYNFSQIDGEDVTLYFDGIEVDDWETDGDGEFSGVFTIPAISSGTYDATATQTDYNIVSEIEEFKVGLMLVILSDYSGPTGTDVTITGTGFTAGKTWNATIGDEEITDGEGVETDGTLSYQFYVPTLDVDTYTITVWDEDTDIDVLVEFEVTATTMAETDPLVAPNDYNLTISGSGFADDEGAALEFVLYNATDDWDMDVYNITSSDVTPYDVEMGEDGVFEGWWEVLDDDELSIGDYTINVTDTEDITYAQVSFSVVSKTEQIESRKSAFEVGDTVSFDVVGSFKQEASYIKIWDPQGDLYFVTDDLEEWVKVGTDYVAPYYSQTSGGNPMILIPDAPLGTWTWTWYDEDDDKIDSGTFTVGPSSAAVLTEQMTDLAGDVTGLSDTVTGLADTVGDLASDFGDVSAAVADTAAAVASVTSSVSDLADVVGDIADEASNAKTAADNAKSAADAAKDAADDAKTAASGLGTLVYGAIGASLVAAFAAIFSLMQINKKIA